MKKDVKNVVPPNLVGNEDIILRHYIKTNPIFPANYKGPVYSAIHWTTNLEGKKHGYEVGFNKEDGRQVIRYTYYNGELTGLHLAWHPNGKVACIAYYKNDKLHGLLQKFDYHGNLVIEHNYVDGRLHGLCREFYPNGQVQYVHSYDNGNFHGLSKGWRPNGSLEWEENYNEGELVGGTDYPEGKSIET
jgi:antitoxin component YwqK of YwqJK toxin-antitoxin module